jgi:hypothetical protein
MAKDIITKLQQQGGVNSVTGTDLPIAYVEKGNRSHTNVNLTIQNNTNSTTGYFELKEKQNEGSTETTRQIPFSVKANGTSEVQIAVQDFYEASMYMYLNNKLVDLVYMADGAWNLDYNKNNTSINQFIVQNESNVTIIKDEHRLFRNATLSGSTLILKNNNGSPITTGNFSQYFVSATTPTETVNSGDRWFDTSTGVELVWIDDGGSSQWVQPFSVPGPSSGGMNSYLNESTIVTANTGYTLVYAIPTSGYTGGFFDYTVSNTSGYRAGNIMSIWSGTTANFTETSTNDIGDTSQLTFSVDVVGSDAVLSTSATTNNWVVKVIIRSI